MKKELKELIQKGEDLMEKSKDEIKWNIWVRDVEFFIEKKEIFDSIKNDVKNMPFWGCQSERGKTLFNSIMGKLKSVYKILK